MRNLLKENYLVSPFLVFYLIHSMQTGSSVLDLRPISKYAGYDAWISIIISGISIHIVIFLLYRILNNGQGDIIAIHKELFGKWIGGFLSLMFLVYLLLLSFTILRSYVEVIQLWVFPQLTTWFFSLVLLCAAGYFVINGFRVVTGICFLSTLYSIPILLTFLFPLKFAHFSNLLPILDHSFLEIIKSSKTASLGMSGFELILMYYPFIKNPNKSEKWAHLAIVVTTFVYVFIAMVTFVFYNQDQLQQLLWGTITIWKIIELPFFERFEHLGIAAWIFIVLPNICLTIWGAHRGVLEVFPFNKKFVLIVILLLLVIATGMVEDRTSIERIRDISGEVTFYFIYGYIPLLFILQRVIIKMRGSK